MAFNRRPNPTDAAAPVGEPVAADAVEPDVAPVADSVVDDLRSRLVDLQSTVERLVSEATAKPSPTKFAGVEIEDPEIAGAARTLRFAQQTADQVISDARKEGDLIVAAAERRSEDIVAAADGVLRDAERQREEILRAAEEVVRAAESKRDVIIAEARERAEADYGAERDRVQQAADAWEGQRVALLEQIAELSTTFGTFRQSFGTLDVALNTATTELRDGVGVRTVRLYEAPAAAADDTAAEAAAAEQPDADDHDAEVVDLTARVAEAAGADASDAATTAVAATDEADTVETVATPEPAAVGAQAAPDSSAFVFDVTELPASASASELLEGRSEMEQAGAETAADQLNGRNPGPATTTF